MWRDAHACRGTRTPRVTVEEKQGPIREYSFLKADPGTCPGPGGRLLDYTHAFYAPSLWMWGPVGGTWDFCGWQLFLLL